jgi:hypothetical protein
MRGSVLGAGLVGVPCLVVLASTLVLDEALAGEPPRPTSSGFPLIGNGVQDGPGATLGRIFLRLSIGSAGVPLDLVFTSNVVTVAPVTCSEPSDLPCTTPGRGEAGVRGHPSAIFETVTKLKLAAAQYLPRGSSGAGGEALRGWSIETALEGSLYAGTASDGGAPADLRLFPGDRVRMLDWGVGDLHPSRRPYADDTGTGILIGDEEPMLFPGWVRGMVVSRGPDALLVDLTSSEVEAVTHPRTGDVVVVSPDFDRARAAGLPAGVFGRIEVNLSGVGTASRVIAGAASNDVEIRVPADEDEIRFLRGDCNGDLARFSPIPDVMTLLGWNFAGGREPPCLAACDADGDGKVIGVVSDAIYLLQHFYNSGAPPLPPYPECGPEPEPSDLSCKAAPDCP